MKRRSMLGWVACAPLPALTGCVTAMMHQQKSYAERIQGALISADKQTFVVVGGQHHYIFRPSPQLLAALDPRLQPAIDAASFGGFKVDANNKIQGRLTLRTRADASPAQLALASAAGFVSKEGRLWAEMEMRGDRYAATRDLPLPMQRFNKEYQVNVVELDSGAKRALKVAATPVTVAADGVLVIGAIVLSPILLPLLLLNICLVCGNAS